MMKSPLNIVLLLVVAVFFFTQCRYREKKIADNIVQQDSTTIFRGGLFILGPSRDSIGNITEPAYTVNSKIEVDYYPNGKIHKWKEYFGDKYPKCIVYYDTNGVFDTFVGNPFLKYYEKYKTNEGEKWRGIQTINPPNVNCFITLKDSGNTKSKPDYLRYDISLAEDTCNWFFIENERISKKGHYFVIRFYFIDSTLNIYRRADREIFDNGKMWRFDPVPYKAYSFEEMK